MAQTLDDQIEARVRPFVEQRVRAFVDELSGELAVLVRKAAADVLLVGGSASGRAAGAPRRASAASAGARSNGRIRRSSDQLEQTAQHLQSYIAKNPGQRMEQIGDALGSTTRELRRPLQQLIDAGAVRREGEKRASRYYVGGAKGRKPAKSAVGRRRSKKKTTKRRR